MIGRYWDEFGLPPEAPVLPEYVYGGHSAHVQDEFGVFAPEVCETCRKALNTYKMLGWGAGEEAQS